MTSLRALHQLIFPFFPLITGEDICLYISNIIRDLLLLVSGILRIYMS